MVYSGRWRQAVDVAIKQVSIGPVKVELEAAIFLECRHPHLVQVCRMDRLLSVTCCVV